MLQNQLWGVSIWYYFWLTFQHFGTCLADNCLWIRNPIHTLVTFIPAVLLAKIMSWIWSTILWRYLVLCCISSVKISMLKIGSPFFTAQHDQHLSANICIIHSWTSFELFFYRNILTIQCTTLENSTFPFISFSQWSETRKKKQKNKQNKCKNPASWHIGMRKILMVVDKIICRFWELAWLGLRIFQYFLYFFINFLK